ITVFRPSSFFVLVHTGLGLQLQVQVVPLMQVFLRLDPSYHGQTCGLCGNFNQNQADDFRTLSGVVEGTAAAFANTWKTQAACPNVKNSFEDPCSLSHWCSLLTDPAGAFSRCHSVDPTKYYEACVGDACACDSGGDCECFCTAVAAYAQACRDMGVCVSWRTPDICPLFCDYYNPEGRCEWHYQPCGAPCMRTCRNPGGRCLHDLRGLEGEGGGTQAAGRPPRAAPSTWP
uniref:VWFD domain-containing protein n=1 Tax=Ursus maritimus TaxID=29073 RepID=A0A452TIA4_URSMA